MDPGDEALFSALVKADRSESLAPLAAGLAKELNQLLARILAAVALGDEAAAAPEALKDAHDACLAARDIARRLLTLAEPGAAARTTFSPREILEEAAAIAAAGGAAEVTIAVAEDAPALSGERAQIVQVFQNLIRNAAEAMSPPPQRPRIQMSAGERRLAEGEIAGLGAGDFVEFEVRDNGTGIAPEQADKIWEPFFTTRKHGAGLGLPTALAIVRRHGGQMGVDSQPGVGTVITVFLPQSRPAQAGGGQESGASRFRTGRVLVMDDDEKFRPLVAGLLERLGFKCDLTAGGEEAVGCYRRYWDVGRPYDAVLLDLSVRGGMGGEEAFVQLRELDPDVRAIGCGPEDPAELARRCRDLGFDGWLAKPYRLNELAEVLKIVLG